MGLMRPIRLMGLIGLITEKCGRQTVKSLRCPCVLSEMIFGGQNANTPTRISPALNPTDVSGWIVQSLHTEVYKHSCNPTGASRWIIHSQPLFSVVEAGSLGLNNPPASAGGIQEYSWSCRSGLNDPPAQAGGIYQEAYFQ